MLTIVPFFSIIVVCLNATNMIQPTIESILRQTCTDFEIIIKDGQSKDGTLAKVPQEDRIKVYCEADKSVYDAMNQATHYSIGEYIIYMNCGDVFASDTVLAEVKASIGEKRPTMVYGDYERDGIRHCQPAMISDFYLYRTPMCHQSIFFEGDAIRKMSPYDITYKILADYDLELRLHRKQCEMLYVDVVVCSYLGGGLSESKKGILINKSERKVILEKYFSVAERLKYQLIWKATMPKLRGKMMMGKSSKWIRGLYQRIVNKINRH